MHTGWIQVYLEPQTVDGAVFGITLHFEAERLDGYSLSLVDERYGTWDDYSEAKLLAQRDAHDAWLVSTIGPGTREPGPGGLELTYSFTWGKVWSTFDARAGSSSIGARFQRESPSSESPMP